MAFPEADMKTSEGLDKLLCKLIKATWEHQIDNRTAGAINSQIKLLLEFRGWMAKSPVDGIQAQKDDHSDHISFDELTALIESLPQEGQDMIVNALKKARMAEGKVTQS